MAKNECSSTGEGRHQTVDLEGVHAGNMVLVGEDGLHGVALIDTNAQGKVVIDIAGRWYLPFENGEDLDVGDAVYCDDTGGMLSGDPTRRTFFGYLLEEIDTQESGETHCVLVVQDHILQGREVDLDMVEDGAILEALADGTGVIAALVAAGLGVSVEADHADASPKAVVAGAVGARACLIVAICTETLAGGGSLPVFSLGEQDGSAEKFFTEAVLTGLGTAGLVGVSAGVLTSAKAMRAYIVNGTANGGAAPAGKFVFVVLALKTA